MNPGQTERTVSIDDAGDFIVHERGVTEQGDMLAYQYTVSSRLLTPGTTAELRRMCERVEELHRRAVRMSADVMNRDNDKLDALLDEMSTERDRMRDYLEVLDIAQASKEST